LDEPVADAERLEDPTLPREVGPVLGMALVEPRRREEDGVGEGARTAQRLPRAIRPFLQEAVERRLHRPAPGPGRERARKDEGREVQRRPLRELLEKRLVG